MSDLRSSGLRRQRSNSADFNPGEGALNLADVMLVFACGLLAALISFWSVELPTAIEVNPDVDVAELEENPVEAESVEQGDGYTELGVVYQDPDTGKLYMVVGEPTVGEE